MCITDEAEAPPTGAPSDVIKQCEVVRVEREKTEDDSWFREIDTSNVMTPDESLDKIVVGAATLMAYFTRMGLDGIFKDHKKYFKFLNFCKREMD